MPYVNSECVRIHYEVEGQGPPLVLMHGMTTTHKIWWSLGYVKELKGDYRLILPDARGCGNSDKPHDIQAYSPELTTGDIVAVLNDLGIKKANYWGYSMGGGIGFQLIRHHPSRFSSYILGGFSPYPRRSETEKQMWNNTSARIRLGAEKGPEAVIAFREKTLGRVESDEGKRRIRSNDYKALNALRQNLTKWPSSGDLLSRISVPCLLYAGERDPRYNGVKEAAKHIPDASFISLSGLDHGRAVFLGLDLILPHVKRFLSRVTG
jgi:pimeloyl-ACP methyl ester carboxylesterase